MSTSRDTDRAAPVSLVKAGPPHGADGRPGRPSSSAAAETAAEGWLVIAVRMPVRIVTLLLIVPVRIAWDALTVCGRLLKRAVWGPFTRALTWVWEKVLAPVLFAVFVWPWLALWRWLLAPAGRALAAGARGLGAALAWLGRTLILVPLKWTWVRLLTPLGHGTLAVLRGVGDGLAWVGRYLLVGLRGVGDGLAWVGRYLLVGLRGVGDGLAWVGRYLLAVLRGVGDGLAWLGRYLLVVPGRAVGTALVWMVGMLVVAPAVGLYRWVLTPLGHGLVACVRGFGAGVAWLWRYAVVVPAVAFYRWVLAPTGRAFAFLAREIADALRHAWRVAGYVSRAVFRFFKAVLRVLVADPAVWLWQHVARPFGRGVRDGIWRPAAQAVREAGRSARAAFAAARQSVRQTRAEIRRALFGAQPAAQQPAPQHKPLPVSERVPWGAGSPHNSATSPNAFGSKRDDADFRTL